ncbi:hypothetical protein [Butyrivibrio sp. FC2001]|uniref:hypothetical protein n=1 Tax=Butyrivibrio sp. FC2001 TaxID=1280671 RepID=UPI00041E42EE|nr:hypothetical protein [Butyrivibrio sp. FC2001]
MIGATIAVVLPIAVYIFMNLITVRVTKVKFGEAMPVTMILAVFIMIISHFVLSSFYYAISFFYVLSFVSLIYLLYMVIKPSNEDEKNVFLKNAFSNGFFAFIILCVAIIIWDKGRRLAFFDEFSHWGMMVKTMFRLDDYYTVNESNLIVHKDYPPFSSLINLIWVMINRNYSEKGCILSLHFYELSILILPIVEKYKEEKRIFSVSLMTTAMLAIVMLIMAGTQGYFPSIYADTPLMCTISLAMLLATEDDFFDNKFYQFCYIITCAAAMLFKQTGIALVLIPSAMLVWRIVFTGKYYGKRIGLILYTVFFALPGLACIKIWNGYVKPYNISKEFDMARVDFKSALRDIFSNGGGVYSTDFNTFMDGLIRRNVMGLRVSVSFLGAYLILIAIIALVLILLRKEYPVKDTIGVWFSLTCGTVGYYVIMAITFVFFIVQRNLSGYGRYASTYLSMEFLVVILLIIRILIKKNKVSFGILGMAFIILVLALVINPNRIYKITPSYFQKETKFDRWKVIAGSIDEKLPDGVSFYLLNDPKEDIKYVVHYMNDTNPLNIKFCDYTFSATQEDTELVKGIMDSIAAVDYLYVKDVPEKIESLFVTSDGKQIKSDALYKVINTDAGMILEKQ